MKRVEYVCINFLLLTLTLTLITSSPSIAQMGHHMDKMEGETKVVEGITGRLKIAPTMHMLDLYLSDAKTGKVIEEAQVKAVITMPDGKKVEKELSGMEMRDVFSFMNTVDLSQKGKYSLNIEVEVGKKKVIFPFTYEVK